MLKIMSSVEYTLKQEWAAGTYLLKSEVQEVQTLTASHTGKAMEPGRLSLPAYRRATAHSQFGRRLGSFSQN